MTTHSLPTRTVSAPEQVLRRLEWKVVRRLDGLVQGDYRTAFYGTGLDFADLREYQPGDDIRHIDWNVTARTTSPHIRQYLDERDLTAWLLLDRSPSMGFGRVGRAKEDVLTELATTLARLLTRSGNRVGAVLADNTVEQIVEPKTGRNQVLRIARELLRAPSGTGAATDLGILLRTAMAVARRRSLLFVVSDFISAPGWEKPLTQLARRHEVVCIRLYDPGEDDLPDAGIVTIEDAETGEQLLVDTSDPRFRQRFRDAAAARHAELEQHCARAGVELHDLSTSDDLVRALVRMSTRARLRRR